MIIVTKDNTLVLIAAMLFPVHFIMNAFWSLSISDLLSYVTDSKNIKSLRPRQMDATSQTTFSSAFSWMKMFHFWIKFHWSLFLKV